MPPRLYGVYDIFRSFDMGSMATFAISKQISRNITTSFAVDKQCTKVGRRFCSVDYATAFGVRM